MLTNKLVFLIILAIAIACSQNHHSNSLDENLGQISMNEFSFELLSPGAPREWYKSRALKPLSNDLMVRAMKFNEISYYHQMDYQTLYWVTNFNLRCLKGFVVALKVHNDSQDYLYLIARNERTQFDTLIQLASLNSTRFGNSISASKLQGDSLLLFGEVLDSFRGSRPYKDSIWWSIKIDSHCNFRLVDSDTLRLGH